MSDLLDSLDIFFNHRPSPNSKNAADTERARIFRYLVATKKTHIRYNGKIYAVTTKLVEATK